jgi:CRISPR-associated endoribonuclease Cas6/Csy4 subtype I-F
MNRYYFDVRILGSFKERHIIVSKIMTILHCTINGKDDSTISVGFPFWQEHADESYATVGDVLRFVGDKTDLIMFSRNHSLNELCENDAIEINKIKDVPLDSVEVIYKRNRAIEKHFKYKRNDKILKFKPKFKVKSSSKDGFTLFIDMIKSESRVNNGYTTYGLSKNGSTFPLF